MEPIILEQNGGALPPLDARVRRSRTGLRQALLELLDARPLAEITIRDIAASAGVGYTTYFRHYPSKEALLHDLAADEIGRLSDLTIPVYDDADPRKACVALFAYVDGRRALWAALLAGAAGFVRAEMMRRGREASATMPKGWLPGDLALVLIVGAILELLTWWLQQPDLLPPEQMAEILERMAIRPAKTTF